MKTKLLPTFYEAHLKSQLSRAEYLILYMLVSIMQIHRIVKLEELASIFPHKILFQSRRKKLQRFLSIPQLTLEIIWFPLIRFWISQEFEDEEVLLIAIDRTQWRGINLLTISLIYDRRAIPIYFHLLPKVGCCNFEQQKTALIIVLNLLSSYQKIVLGDREFCSVELAEWLQSQPMTDFCTRLKRSHYIEVEPGIWQQLNNIGLVPGISFFLKGVKITKTKGFTGANIACKWKGKYRGWTAEEGWFILTSLPNLDIALSAYSKRFGIEEMFRDFKSGGYNLEDCYSVVMNLLMSKNLDVSEQAEISLTGYLSEMEWETLFPQINVRIILKTEARQALAQIGAADIFSCDLDKFSEKQAIKLVTGIWHFK